MGSRRTHFASIFQAITLNPFGGGFAVVCFTYRRMYPYFFIGFNFTYFYGSSNSAIYFGLYFKHIYPFILNYKASKDMFIFFFFSRRLRGGGTVQYLSSLKNIHFTKTKRENCCHSLSSYNSTYSLLFTSREKGVLNIGIR